MLAGDPPDTALASFTISITKKRDGAKYQVRFSRSDYGHVLEIDVDEFRGRPVWTALLALGTRYLGAAKTFYTG